MSVNVDNFPSVKCLENFTTASINFIPHLKQNFIGLKLDIIKYPDKSNRS